MGSEGNPVLPRPCSHCAMKLRGCCQKKSKKSQMCPQNRRAQNEFGAKKKSVVPCRTKYKVLRAFIVFYFFNNCVKFVRRIFTGIVLTRHSPSLYPVRGRRLRGGRPPTPLPVPPSLWCPLLRRGRLACSRFVVLLVYFFVRYAQIFCSLFCLHFY